MNKRVVYKGTVKSFSSLKGYGFITSPQLPDDVFVYHTAIDPNTFHYLIEDEEVMFRVRQTPKGLRAQNVIRLNPSAMTPDQQLTRLAAIYRRRIIFMLVGKTGVGKSSTINALLGKPIARTHRFRPETMEVMAYHDHIQGIPCTVIDTPGLADALPESGNDERYIEKMRSEIEEVDCLWFVVRLDETRVTSDEQRNIRLLSQSFGAEIWERSIIIFTFADKVPVEEYEEFLQERTNLIHAEIGKYISRDKAHQIPSVAVTNASSSTPDGTLWLSKLLAKVFTRISDRAVAPFLLAMEPRITWSQPSTPPNSSSSHADSEDTLLAEQLNKLRNSTAGLRKIVAKVSEDSKTWEHKHNRTQRNEGAPLSSDEESLRSYLRETSSIGNTFLNLVHNQDLESKSSEVINQEPSLIIFDAIETVEREKIIERTEKAFKDELGPNFITNLASLGATVGGAMGAIVGTAIAGPIGMLAGAAIGALAGLVGRHWWGKKE